jgi:alkylation response protein AidB-like acyl-CoA dehydrogenase
MKRAGFFRMCKPRTCGGLEVDPMTALRVIEEVGRIDVSAAWNLFLSSTATPFHLLIPEKGIEEYLADPDYILAGAVYPPGKAVAVDGGYRISGRWPFCSGVHHADWILQSASLFEGDEPKRGEDGNPIQLTFHIPASDAEILDTWYTMGMRATGSTDVAIKDLFVPAHRAGARRPLTELPKALDCPINRFTFSLPVAAAAAPALGGARATIDSLIELGTKKTPAYAPSPLAGRSAAQMQLGRAEALLGAARAYLYDAVEKGWKTACSGEMLTPRNKIDIQLASSHAVETAAEVARLVHQAAGTSSIRQEQAFERRFRDLHTLSQHAFVSHNRFESVGKYLFGQPNDWPLLLV